VKHLDDTRNYFNLLVIMHSGCLERKGRKGGEGEREGEGEKEELAIMCCS